MLYWDGHVTSAVVPYASDDPDDNIFTRDPAKSPDEDAWVRQ